MMSGWKAYVNGKAVDIKVSDGVYQTIKVPAGTSEVTYAFLPPHEKYAVIVGFLAAFFLLGTWIEERRNARHPRHRRPRTRVRPGPCPRNWLSRRTRSPIPRETSEVDTVTGASTGSTSARPSRAKSPSVASPPRSGVWCSCASSRPGCSARRSSGRAPRALRGLRRGRQGRGHPQPDGGPRPAPRARGAPSRRRPSRSCATISSGAFSRRCGSGVI